MSGRNQIKVSQRCFIHIPKVADNAAKLSHKMEIRFAALVHTQKSPTKSDIKGWSYHGHEEPAEVTLETAAFRMKISNEL